MFTDQTRMLGYYTMKRDDAIVRSIASGFDIVLGINDPEEDVAALKRGVEDGRITEERLRQAVYRVLATKAAIGLHIKQREGTLVPGKEALEVVGCEKFRKWAVEASDSSITLVKNTRNQLPIRPETHKKLLVNFVGNEFTNSLLGQGVATGGTGGTREVIEKVLTDAGFEVHMYEPGKGAAGIGSLKKFRESYDAALIFADLSGFATTNSLRISWSEPMSPGAPWYVPEIPTAFISLNYTNHMVDVPRVPIFINAYNDKPYTIELVVKKLMGESEFRGSYNENVWCGMWDARF